MQISGQITGSGFPQVGSQAVPQFVKCSLGPHCFSAKNAKNRHRMENWLCFPFFLFAKSRFLVCEKSKWLRLWSKIYQKMFDYEQHWELLNSCGWNKKRGPGKASVQLSDLSLNLCHWRGQRKFHKRNLIFLQLNKLLPSKTALSNQILCKPTVFRNKKCCSLKRTPSSNCAIA